MTLDIFRWYSVIYVCNTWLHHRFAVSYRLFASTILGTGCYPDGVGGSRIVAEVPLRCAERWCNLGQLPLIVMDLHGSLWIAMGMFAGSLLQEGKFVSHSLFGCDLDWIVVSHHKWLFFDFLRSRLVEAGSLSLRVRVSFAMIFSVPFLHGESWDMLSPLLKFIHHFTIHAGMQKWSHANADLPTDRKRLPWCASRISVPMPKACAEVRQLKWDFKHHIT